MIYLVAFMIVISLIELYRDDRDSRRAAIRKGDLYEKNKKNNPDANDSKNLKY